MSKTKLKSNSEVKDILSHFKLPISYNSSKKSLNPNIIKDLELLNVNKSSLKRVSMSTMMLGAGIYIFYDHNTAHCAGNTNSSKSATNVSSSSGSNDKNNDKDNNNDDDHNDDNKIIIVLTLMG